MHNTITKTFLGAGITLLLILTMAGQVVAQRVKPAHFIRTRTNTLGAEHNIAPALESKPVGAPTLAATAFVYLPLVLKPEPTPTPTSTPTMTPTPTTQPPWVTIIGEDFEGAFPGAWTVVDGNGPAAGEYFWAKRDCRVYAGSFSSWAVGGGANGAALGCGSSYSNNASAVMLYGPFSLAGAIAGDLSFKLWLNSELRYDNLCRLASIDGTNFYGSCTSGNTTVWIDRVLDLTNVPPLGNLMGQPNVWVMLGFFSDSSITRTEGAYVDDIVLRKCIAAPCPVMSSPAPNAGNGRIVDVPTTMTLAR